MKSILHILFQFFSKIIKVLYGGWPKGVHVHQTRHGVRCESSLSVCEEASGITIPQDIITSILYLLPIKSLCRFRCVSKSWKSLLSEPYFIKTHQKTLNRTHLVFGRVYNGTGLRYYSVPFSNNEAVSTLMKHRPELSNYIFIGSANGLVMTSGYDHLRKLSTFKVLNLITKESVELPDVMEIHDQWQGVADAHGFGYDSMTDDYKVVKIFHTKSSSNVYVYSLRTYNWRQLSDSPYDHYSISGDRGGVFVNGFLHWIARKGSDLVIVAFSLTDETFSEVPSPRQYNNVHVLSYYTCRLFALGDKLAIFSKKGLVWLMNEYGLENSWTKIVVHGYNETTMIKPENLFATHDLMRIYYREDGSFPESGDISNKNLGMLTSSFVESLASPKLDRANLPYSREEHNLLELNSL